MKAVLVKNGNDGNAGKKKAGQNGLFAVNRNQMIDDQGIANHYHKRGGEWHFLPFENDFLFCAKTAQIDSFERKIKSYNKF